jgi:hypothetical protein
MGKKASMVRSLPLPYGVCHPFLYRRTMLYRENFGLLATSVEGPLLALAEPLNQLRAY